MKTIRAYKTTDGLVFESEEKAALHQIKLDFCEWYESHCDELYCERGSPDPKDLYDWMMTRKDYLIRLLGGYNDR